MRLLIAIAPIALAAMIAIKNRFYRSARWMQFHVIADRMLHEIMFFRTRCGLYKPTGGDLASGTMAKRIASCEQSLLGSDSAVLTLAAPERKWGSDWLNHPQSRARVLGLPLMAAQDALEMPLDTERYVRQRLQEQLDKCKADASRAAWMMLTMTWAANLIGGVSTLLVLLDGILTGGTLHWVTVTVNVQNLLQTLMSQEGYEMTLLRANRAIKELSQVMDDWKN